MNIFITEAGAMMLGELERIIAQNKHSWGNRETLSACLSAHLNSLLTAVMLQDQWP